MEKMKIEIWSDIACPYCYIGKRRMEKALAQFPHADEIELVWHSYELNPDLPKKRTNQSIYSFIAGQYNITEDAQRKNMEGIATIAKSLGLDYDFDKVVVANTSDALRLIKLAASCQLADAAEEVFFKAYFCDGEDISDSRTLTKLATGIGLPESEVTAVLSGDMYCDEIQKDMRYSEDVLDLQYIPFYLFNNKDVIQGSLAIEEYLEMLNKAYDDWKKNGVASGRGDRIGGQACSIDGVCSF